MSMYLADYQKTSFMPYNSCRLHNCSLLLMDPSSVLPSGGGTLPWHISTQLEAYFTAVPLIIHTNPVFLSVQFAYITRIRRLNQTREQNLKEKGNGVFLAFISHFFHLASCSVLLPFCMCHSGRPLLRRPFVLTSPWARHPFIPSLCSPPSSLPSLLPLPPLANDFSILS